MYFQFRFNEENQIHAAKFQSGSPGHITYVPVMIQMGLNTQKKSK
jgi:hypothetical protein